MSERFEKGDVLLGKLEVIRVLGEGGMGVVYEVEHRMTKHRRALKLLHAHISQNAEVTVRLLREASVAGRLRTKHVVETFDAGQLDNGAAYVLMEMLEGRSFAEMLEAGRPPPGRVVSLVWEACEGLAVAHKGGIVHRDLKPDNMFVAKEVDGTEIVKLLDFGISKFSERHDYQGTLTADGAIMGTPFYMSPEQTRGLSDIDGRTDIYAVGVILYEALSGQLPFNGESFPMLVVAIHEGYCRPLTEVAPDVDPKLAEVVHKAMATEREDRWKSVRDLQEALRPFADRELPERVGADSALAFGATMATDPPPRLSVTATPMAAADTAMTPSRDAGGPPRWPLYAGIGLVVVGLAAGGAAIFGAGSGDADGGDGGAGETGDVRGLPGEETTGAAGQPLASPDAGRVAARAHDGGTDAGPPVGVEANGRDGDGRDPQPTMIHAGGMRVGMDDHDTTMTTTITMMNIEIETGLYDDP